MAAINHIGYVLGPGLEPCADAIVSAAARRSILVGGGAAWSTKLSIFAYLFQKFFNKELIGYQGMHVEQLFFAVVWPQIRNIIIKTRLQ